MSKAVKCEDMTDVRREIDRLDRMIAPLLVERLRYIEQAGHIKPDRDAVHDDWRIEDVVRKAKNAAASSSDFIETDDAYIDRIYRFLIDFSIKHEFKIFDQLNDKKEN